MQGMFISIIKQIEEKKTKYFKSAIKNLEYRPKIFKCLEDLKAMKCGEHVEAYAEPTNRDSLASISDKTLSEMTLCAQKLYDIDMTLESLQEFCKEAAGDNSNEANIKAALVHNLYYYTLGKSITKSASESLDKSRKIADEAQESSNPNASALLKFVAYATCSKAETYLEAPAVKCLAENSYVDAFLEWIH